MRLLQNNLSLFILLAGFSCSAQVIEEFMPKPEKRITYLFFGISVPLRTHLDSEAAVNNSRWMLDGIQTRFGGGIHYNRWLGIGLHVATEWRISESLITVPIYMNVRIAPQITEDVRFYIQPGYGASFALGRGSLSGDYSKISIGLEQDDALSIYAEFSQYGFSLDRTGHINALSLGVAVTIF